MSAGVDVVYVDVEPDWAGVYVDGELEHENHTVDGPTVLDLLEGRTINSVARYYDVDLDALDRVSLPVEFAELQQVLDHD